MQLSLNEDTERLIEQNLKTGGYRSAEEVVHAALVSLSQERGEFHPGEWDQLLAEGEASLSQGVLDGDAAYEARRAARLNRGT